MLDSINEDKINTIFHNPVDSHSDDEEARQKGYISGDNIHIDFKNSEN